MARPLRIEYAGAVYQVGEKFTGNYRGCGRMLLRETIGKFASGLIFGLGYFWAIWDKDNQAWHDKIA